MGKAAKKTRWRTFSFNSSKEEPTDSQTTNKSSSDTSNKSSATTNGRTSSPSSLNPNYSQILSDNNNSNDSYHHNNNNNNNNDSNNYNNTNPVASSLNNRNNNNSNNHYNNGYKKHYTNNKENNNFTTTSNSYYNRERSQRFISNKAPNSYYNKSNYNKDYRSGTSIVSNDKDKILETKSNGEASAEGEEKNETVVTPPILFNEDEYTRITTPRQDVLFKKGYLSRMNNNKTATTTITNNNSTESTTTTNSDLDSSVSTLSPATTPSTMEYSAGTKYSSDMVDSMDYPMYYPGCYYDENGVMVFPIYANGYNYYQNASNASSNAPPVYLMPYPYSYDYYMPPTASTPPTSPANEEEEETTPNTNDSEDKNYINEITNTTAISTTTTSITDTKNQYSNNGTCTPISSSEDGVSSSNQGEENLKEDTSNIPSDNLSTASGNSTTPAEKPLIPICPNEINGFIYPAGPNYNGYYNNFYYYNGASQLPTRPLKYKSRKRFTRVRNSSQQSQNSAETTTDYSDEESVAAATTPQYQQQFTYNRRQYNNNYNYNNRYHNGYHHNNHHNYHNGGRYNDRHFHHQIPVDITNLVMHTNLNVDVQEFYPRHIDVENVDNCDSINVTSAKTQVASGKMQDKSQIKDKEEKIKTKDGDNEKTMTTKDVGSKVMKQSSHNSGKSSSRVTKKENIESIKHMEQQNIDLLAISKLQTKPVKELDVEWNVIKKGKRIKVVNKNGFVDEAQKEVVKLEKVCIATAKDSPIPVQAQNTDESSKESIVVTKETTTKPTVVIQKPKKSKAKNKKNKKLICGSKLDGFEIIEPDFGVKVNGIQEKSGTDENGIDDSDEDYTVPIENGLSHDSDEDVTTSDDIKKMSEEGIAELLQLNAAPMHLDDEKDAELIEILNDLLADDDNEIIDISDDDICPKMVSPPPVIEKLSKSKNNEIKEGKNKDLVKLENKVIKSEVLANKPQITTAVTEITTQNAEIKTIAIEELNKGIKLEDTAVQKVEASDKKVEFFVLLPETPAVHFVDKKVKTSPKAVTAPVKTIEAPVKKIKASVETVEAAVKSTEAPVKTIEASVKTIEAPVKKVETLVELPTTQALNVAVPIDASVMQIEAPVNTVKAPVKTIEAPVKKLDTSVKKAETPAHKVEVKVLINEKLPVENEAPFKKAEDQIQIVDAPIIKTEATLPKTNVPDIKAETGVSNVAKTGLKIEKPAKKASEPIHNQENKIKNIENSIKKVKDSVKPAELKIAPAVYQNGIDEHKMVEVDEEIIVPTKAAPKQKTIKEQSPVFDYNYKIKENVADLERDLKKNLKLLNGDDDIQLKSPIINPLTDFPITNAIQKWLQTKQNESFDSLFHIQNFKKLHLTEDVDDDDDEDDEDDYEDDDTEEEDTESEISDKPITDDSDYASDIQVKTNTDGANDQAGTSSTITSSNSKLNTVVNGKSKNDVKVTKLNTNMIKDKLCAIM